MKHLSRIGLTVLVLSVLIFAGWTSVANAAESTFDRITRTGVLRVAGLVGEEPQFHKDLTTGEWSGYSIAFARSLAKELEVKLEIVESTWGNSILDLRSGKIDISFGLNPTVKRALVIDFSTPMFYSTFGIVTRKGFTADTWAKLNNPSVKVAVDMGSAHEIIARHYCPNAKITAFRTRDEAIMAIQSGRADCMISMTTLILSILKKNPDVGTGIFPTPRLTMGVCAGLPYDENKRFRDIVNVWTTYNRAVGNIREWIFQGLADIGIPASLVPADLEF